MADITEVALALVAASVAAARHLGSITLRFTDAIPCDDDCIVDLATNTIMMRPHALDLPVEDTISLLRDAVTVLCRGSTVVDAPDTGTAWSMPRAVGDGVAQQPGPRAGLRLLPGGA